MVVDRGEDRLRGWSWCAAEIETADDDGRSGSLSGGTTGVSTVAVGVACVDAIRTMITKPKSITKPEWCAIAITHAAQAGINRATRRRCRPICPRARCGCAAWRPSRPTRFPAGRGGCATPGRPSLPPCRGCPSRRAPRTAWRRTRWFEMRLRERARSGVRERVDTPDQQHRARGRAVRMRRARRSRAARAPLTRRSRTRSCSRTRAPRAAASLRSRLRPC